MSKRIFLATAVLVAAVAVFVFFTLPPVRHQLTAADDGTVAGILHIHTNRSDGRSAPDAVAAAAAQAGLKFVVFTDHGDATRSPDPPTYRSGVLCLDGVEISTNQGHYVAVGLPAAPYPLAGEARDVVEDVRRLGGFGIAAHPDSPNPKLAWREWTAPFDGIELLNPDTSWRMLTTEPGVEPKRQMLTALVDYQFRPTETIANVLRDSRSIAAWQALAARRPVVAIGGVDAHAKVPLGNRDDSYWIPFFGYESAFRLMSVHVLPAEKLTGNATADAALLMHALRAGHLYTAVDGLATPPAFEFMGANSRDTGHEGDEIDAGGGVSLHVRSNAPATYTTVVHRGTSVLAAARDAGDWTVHADDTPAVYWVEIVAPHEPQPITWLRSNPIYVRERVASPVATTRTETVETLWQPDGDRAIEGWQTEHDPVSTAVIGRDGSELSFRYSLAGGTQGFQVAALTRNTPKGVAVADRLTFAARAERPMRLSVQLRAKNGDRWQRSVYIDAAAREQTVRFDDVTPVGVTPTQAAPLADVVSVMFLVDLTNSKPGASGRVWLSGVRFERKSGETPPRP